RATRSRHERLRGQMEHQIWTHLLERVAGRRRIAEVAFQQRDPFADVVDVLGAASPAQDAEDRAVSAGEQVVDEMAAGESGHSGHEYSAHEGPSNWNRVRTRPGRHYPRIGSAQAAARAARVLELPAIAKTGRDRIAFVKSGQRAPRLDRAAPSPCSRLRIVAAPARPGRRDHASARSANFP